MLCCAVKTCFGDSLGNLKLTQIRYVFADSELVGNLVYLQWFPMGKFMGMAKRDFNSPHISQQWCKKRNGQQRENCRLEASYG